MALRSRLFRGDPKLEAVAISDPAHVVQGATGEHVRKIQTALILLDSAAISADGIYGPATAAAVLAYKQKRNIVNRAYQTQPDNIVGKMTMATLDQEMVRKEAVPSRPTRFEIVLPPQRPSAPSYLLPQPASRLLLGFKVGAVLADVLPELPPSLTLTPHILELKPQETGIFQVRNGIGKEIVLPSRWIATMAPLDLPANAHHLTKIKITQNPQGILVFPHNVGSTSITVVPSSLFDPFMNIIVLCEVGVFFHFLDGPAGIKTVRKEGDLDDILKTMNDVYQRNHAGFVFVKSGVNPALRVSGLGTTLPGVRVRSAGGGPDWDAITRNKADVLFNVYFVGSLVDLSNLDNPEFNRLLAITTRPPNDSKPLRCCICRDPQAIDPPGIASGKTLAHEVGHALGEDDDQNDTNSLMFFKQSGMTDTRIDTAMAQRMLSSFKAFPP